jgi:ABC-type transport system substrate-binding protein
VGAASVAGAAAFLAACGGSNTTTGDQPASGLVYTPVDTTSKATKGGILDLTISNDVDTFDGVGGNSGTGFGQSLYAHSRLMKYVPGKTPNAPDGSVEPDAATGYEVSGDGLQWTYRLRPNHKFDSRPPTNGRAMNSADVKYTWERFTRLNQGRFDLTGRPESPVTSVETPDAQTVVFKLSFPYAPLATMLPYYRYLSLQPVEYEGFNYKGDMRGAGPWRLTEYVPSSRVSYRKNPDWYDADKILLDGIDLYVVPQYATGLSQFRAGALWYYALSQEDVLPTKRDLPDLVMQSSGVFTRSIAPYTLLSSAPGSPFLDERVRQAASMSVDRDLYIDTYFNVQAYRDEGIEVKTAWNTQIAAGIPNYWTDPKVDKEIGKYYQYDPQAAKQLLSAAGFPRGIETDFHYVVNQYGPAYLRRMEMLHGMYELNGDFKLAIVQHDYATDWVPNYHQGKGQFKGMAYATQTTQADIDGYLYAQYRSGSDKTCWGPSDPIMDGLIDQQRREPDEKKRTQIIKDFDRYASKMQFRITAGGEALTYRLNQPWFGNYGVWNAYDGGSEAAEVYVKTWFDASKKTA